MSGVHERTTDLAPDLVRITAPNAGPMTYTGTNTYLLGRVQVAVIDPGPDDPVHLDRILGAVPAGGTIRHILVTHGHLDHSAGVSALARATGARVLAFGRARDGRSEAMDRMAAQLDLGGGEGIDDTFVPDERLADGAKVQVGDAEIVPLHTPGHLSSHMCFVCPALGAIFTGDHVMGWSSTLISPPDGSVTQFMASLDLLLARPERLFYPGHGPEIADGPAAVIEQRDHRRAREAQIVAALVEAGGGTLSDLTAVVYRDVPDHLHPAAARNLLAHLLDLAERGRVTLPAQDLREGAYRLL